ncbi:MAG: two-component regulator propeller domain-containing protein [Saprospiraceae bacterium]
MNYVKLVVALFLVGQKCILSLAQDISYMRLSTSDGFPSDLVYSIIQDRRGMLWFGTDKGLIKYDNKRIRVFSTPELIPDPEIINIYEDSDKRLWINSFSKNLAYLQYDTVHNCFDRYFLNDIVIDFGIADFFEDSDSSVWVTNTTDVVYKINKTTVDKYFLPNSTIQIRRLGGDLLAFGSGHIFNCNDPLQPTLVFDIVKELGGIPKYDGIAFANNRILYSFDECLLLLEYNQGVCRVVNKMGKYIGRVFTDKTNHFWICTSYGAIRFDNIYQDLSNPKKHLIGKKTTRMIEDDQGTFWFCTLDGGVFGLPNGPAITYSKNFGLYSSNLSSISRNDLGDILFGDDEGNVYSINRYEKLSIKRYRSIDGYNRVLEIYPVSKNENWVVTDDGVYFQPLNGKHQKIKTPLGSPKALLFDGDFIWCGSSAGLFYVHKKHGSVYKFTSNRVTALEKDSDDIVWAGGIKGLYNSADSFRSNWGSRFRELENRIVDIHIGGEHSLWAVTPDIGLLKLEVRKGKIIKIEKINSYLKQPINNINSIFIEDSKLVWLATSHGIYSINPSNWETLRYNHHDGLVNNDVKAVVTHGDTLWAASPGGLTRLLLAPLRQKGKFPTYITTVRYRDENNVHEVFLNDAPSQTRTTILPIGATLVEVDFAGLDYRSRGNLFFECRIAEEMPPLQWLTINHVIKWAKNKFGIQSDTIRLDKPVLDFGVNMPPGKYRLSVVAYTQNGVYGSPSDVWHVIMPAPWYATIWFIATVWFLVILALIWAYQVRDKLRKMALAVGRFRLLALQAQINPHFIGNAVNATQRFFFPPEPGRASKYIAIFTDMLRETLDFSETTFITFADEVSYCKQYMDMATVRYGKSKFQYYFSGVESIPSDLPFPSLYLQPIFENATIHGIAPEGLATVLINYSIRNGTMYCTITDNGPGLRAGLNDPMGMTDFKRRSKGIAMLKSKALSLNQLFDLDLQLEVKDRSEITPYERGTRVTVSFSVAKILKAPAKQAKINKYSVPSGHH